MDNRSLWQHITSQKTYPTLDKDLHVEVAIIGSGITGITAAFLLQRAQKKIAVLEADSISGGTTGFSTGNLYIPIQPYYQKIEERFDQNTAQKLAQSRQFAIDFIESTANNENIDCNFSRRPWYLHTHDKNKLDFLKKEAEILARFGLPIEETNYLDATAIKLNNQARFNPLAYVTQLAEIAHKEGCEIFENTKIISCEEKDKTCILHTAKNKIVADKVLMATHTPKGIQLIQLFLAPYRSYVVAAKLTDEQYPNGNFWDLESPHHAVSTHSTTSSTLDIIAVAGQHHKTGQQHDAEQKYHLLENYLNKHYRVANFVYRWSAQHYHSVDGIPYIGVASSQNKNIFIATGFFADGLVYGTLAGNIISDLILNKENEWSSVYEPSRFNPMASSKSFIKESTNVFLQYLKDYPGHIEAKTVDAIKMNEGKIIEINGEKVAVYRDDNNQLHAVSAVCTHMKCIVAWNNAENTWDCPCHGSRFDIEGNVIEGPAYVSLEKIKLS